jgi:hypothetical protein
MKRSDIAFELKRAMRHIGLFLVYSAMLYGVIAGVAHWLKGTGPSGKAGQVESQVAEIKKPSPAASVAPEESIAWVAEEGGSETAEDPTDTTGYWVYLGTFSDKKNTWLHKNFKMTDMPGEGCRVIALEDLLKWDALPSFCGNDCKMGRVIGNLISSEAVMIIRVKKVRGKDYWALVRG